MKYVFVDDGYPEANDYASNYEPLTPASRPLCRSVGGRVPEAARPAWWNALACVLRVMVLGVRSPASGSSLKVAYES